MKIPASLLNFDPQKVGFKSGLEVHQQILTEKKLFCRCPAGLYSDEYDAQVLRHMRPTLSELGEYDGTALMEFKTHKEIIYRLNKDSVCSYEMDDNPPFLINRQAVDIAIEIALLLNCGIVGELHVIRKQYLDGSIPAGFQRTAIIGVNGWIPFKGRRVGIIQLALEEDACREVSDIGHQRIYTTDRLSMPLIEVVTEPGILEPAEGFELGYQISRLLRSTGKIRRGIGSVRQDVNASVTGGTRIEIKGVPRLPLIPDLLFYEAYRQFSLLEIRDLIRERGIDEKSLETKEFDISNELTHPALKEIPEGDVVHALVLKGMAGLIGRHIGPNRRFGDDIAGRVRVIACMNHLPTMLHTDDKSRPGLSAKDRDALRSITGMSDNDCTIVVWGPPGDVETAIKEVIIRCREAAIGIPNETRQRLATGETTFERILPGADRMYPDTDSPPLALETDHVNTIRESLPELPWVRKERLLKIGLPEHQAEMMSISPMNNLFDELAAKHPEEAVFYATILIDMVIRYRRLSRAKNSLNPSDMQEIFKLYHTGKVAREGLRLLIEESARTGEKDWDKLAERMSFTGNPPANFKDVIAGAVKTVLEIPDLKPQVQFRVIMGRVMNELRGLVPGNNLVDLVKTELGDTL